MKDKKVMSDQSTLWGSTLEYWDSWGVCLMIAGGALGFFALAFSLSSSFILWKVAGKSQSELQFKTSTLDAEAERLKRENLALESALQARRIAIRAEKLEDFPGIRLLVQSIPEYEARTLANDIVNWGNSAGWSAVIVSENETGLSPMILGEGVRVYANRPIKSSDITPQETKTLGGADILLSALTAAIGYKNDNVAVGFLPAMFLEGFGYKFSPETIFVTVGPKPMMGARTLEKAIPGKAK